MKRLEAWIKNNTHRLDCKTVALSGATGGIGRELCKRLCSLGAGLLLLDRNKSRSLALIDQLKKEFPHAKIEHITLDLEDFSRVREVAAELTDIDIDYLVLNAGAYSIPRHTCDTGYDNVFQINFLSPYYLATALLPTVTKKGGKVVVVGSIAHNYSKISPDDVDFSKKRAASKVYGNAKRHLMYSLSGERGVAITHPGIAVTNITAHYPKIIYAAIKYPMKLIFMSPRVACLSVLAGIFDDCAAGEWIGPRFLNIWGLPKKQKLRTAKAEEISWIRENAADILEKQLDRQSLRVYN